MRGDEVFFLAAPGGEAVFLAAPGGEGIFLAAPGGEGVFLAAPGGECVFLAGVDSCDTNQVDPMAAQGAGAWGQVTWIGK